MLSLNTTDDPKFFSLFTVLVGTDITDDVQEVTNNKGSTVMFYNNFKYLKSGESKTTFQYRCVNYVKKCRSKIIYNREKGSVMKNEIAHNHDVDLSLYETFNGTATAKRHFSRHFALLKHEKVEKLDDADDDDDDDDNLEKWE